MRMIKQGRDDHAAQRTKLVGDAMSFVGLGTNTSGQAAIALALLALETQFARLNDVLEEVQRREEEI